MFKTPRIFPKVYQNIGNRHCFLGGGGRPMVYETLSGDQELGIHIGLCNPTKEYSIHTLKNFYQPHSVKGCRYETPHIDFGSMTSGPTFFSLDYPT